MNESKCRPICDVAAVSQRKWTCVLRMFAWVIVFVATRACVLAELKPDAELVALGQFNCTACHAATEQQGTWILPKYAPLLEGLKKKVNPD